MSSSAITNSFLNNINLIQQRMASVQNELTSGYRVTTASDAPDEISDLLDTRANLLQATQAQSNLSLAQGTVNTAESSLETGETLIEQALSLGQEGASSTSAGTSSRTTIVTQLQQLQAQLVDISNTTVQGQYVFGGDDSANPPYAMNWNVSANGVTALQSAASTSLVTDARGNSFSISQNAQTIFDHQDPVTGLSDASSVFAGIQGLATALAGGVQTDIDTAMTNLRTAQGYYSQQLASYGTYQDRVSSALTDASSYQTQLRTQLSSLQDADIATAATQLTQYQTQEQAAMAAEGEMSQKSLFDYLG
jgi:flagellar hook-associated protein 3 FlgL